MAGSRKPKSFPPPHSLPPDAIAERSYTVQGYYKGRSQWLDWISGNTLKEARDHVKRGNSLTSGLRIVLVVKTIVE